jgi:transcription termination/antitermination protein NusA
MSQEIIDAVRDIEREKGIESGTLVAALEDALLAAYKKMPGSSRHATVEIDDQGDFRVYSIELPPDVEERLIEEARERKLEELEALEAESGERSHTLISDDELDVDWSDIPEDQIKRADVTPENFGRIAAQTAKQVILQRIREAERAMMYDEYVDRVSEVVTGIVQQAGDRNNVLVDLGKVEALLPRSEQVDGERYEQGSRIKAVITEVRSGTKGPQVILSRRDPELIKTLFELEVPEIADGLVEIRGVAREPGYRSKIAVESHAQGVDPVGACVGPRGSRVRMVVSELRGEKIDIIPWNPEPARFVAKALSPARVREVYIDDDTKEATVVVPDDQLALAIGKEGLNARLAARLTGWRVDIQSDSEFAQAEADAAYGGGDGEELTGRCAAVLSNGKRCPNEALPGSRYCGLPAHQELALHDTDDVEPIEAEEEPALEIRADLLEPEAESLGPESLADVRPDAEALESEAPADIAATRGPDATEIAAAEGEVDLDTVNPERAEPASVPAGISVKPTREGDGRPETPADLDVEGRSVEAPSEGAAPGQPSAPPVTTEEGTPTA